MSGPSDKDGEAEITLWVGWIAVAKHGRLLQQTDLLLSVYLRRLIDSGLWSRVYDSPREGFGGGMDLSIGKLAKLGGVNIDTVRYYERNGLLAPSTRLASGYRRYGDLELARLRFIRRAQKLGFSLKEIDSLLSLSARRNVAQVKRAAQAKLVDVEARIADLQRVRSGLSLLIEACPGHGRASECPILQALSVEGKHENT